MGFLDKLFKKKQAPSEIKERSVMNIQVDDIVSYDLVDYQVVGKLTYNDHGYTWTAYQLIDQQQTIWLSVEMDDELELGIYERAKIKLDEPLPDKIEYEGKTYFIDEKGQAFVKGEGRGQNVNGAEVRYFDYCDEEEEEFLSVEIWGSEIEVSKGYEIDDFEIKIIAGSK